MKISNDSVKRAFETAEKNGYIPTNIIPLYNKWSVLAVKNDRRFNLFIDGETFEITDIFMLKYQYNFWGTSPANVERTKIK